MRTPTAAELAEIYVNTRHERSPSWYKWGGLNQYDRDIQIAGMQAALDALYASAGEGMSSVEECDKAYAAATQISPALIGIREVRNLMLAAFAKKSAEMEAELASREKDCEDYNSKWIAAENEVNQLESKLAAIAKLPEKWRSLPGYPTTGPIFASFLEIAISPPTALSKEEVQRSRFEAWWRQENVDDDGAFTCGEQAAAWSAWQAARAGQ